MDIMDLLKSAIAINTRANRGFLKFTENSFPYVVCSAWPNKYSLNAIDILFNDFLDLHLNWFIWMNNKFNNKELELCYNPVMQFDP